uniref:Uncharacterized protein n=1 Tax=Setaria italica TaxID=4555 RepID=K3YZ81_SETIT
MAGRRRRCGSEGDGEGAGNGPNLSDGSRAGMARNRRLILGFMYGYYDEALDALPLERMPALASRLLEAGVCFGFGDPVTNIMANTLSCAPDDVDGEPAPAPDGARKRKRKKASWDARAREEILPKIAAGDAPSPPEARTIAERSLEGLVTFLTSYFRYLPTWDALRYLCLSRADLLVAVHLIELHRCHRREDKFSIDSHAVKTALKCAALSARLPNVDAFLTGSSALVSCLDDMPAEIFGRRLSVPESVRAILLDRIHAVYLKAITQIPIEDFRSRYHRGFLKAGYCYGPFSPLFNIIVNTIWCDTAFPAPQALELDMICTRILIRVESRDLELSRAIQMSGKDGYETSSWDAAAYTSAADASSHAEREAYLHFVMESLPVVESAVMELLTTQILSSNKILQPSMLLSSSSSHPSKSLEPTDDYKEIFFSQQNCVRKKVGATLLNCEQTKEQYELRFICTVNESVGTKKFRDLKYPYSHVNFLASPKDKPCLTLFFAQVSNHDEDSEHHRSFCQPKSVAGTRIVHPVESYCGGFMDFEKMATGRHPVTNARIISHVGS